MGNVFVLTNEKFLNLHIEGTASIVTINKDKIEHTKIEIFGYYDTAITCGCILNDGTLVIASCMKQYQSPKNYVLLLEEIKEEK